MKQNTLPKKLLLWIFLFAIMSLGFLAGCSEDTTPVIPVPSPTLQVLAVPATPYASSPAAGVCAGPVEEQIASIEIWPDMPDPRCLQLSPEQYLQVTNHTDTGIQYRLHTVPVGSFFRRAGGWRNTNARGTSRQLFSPWRSLVHGLLLQRTGAVVEGLIAFVICQLITTLRPVDKLGSSSLINRI